MHIITTTLVISFVFFCVPACLLAGDNKPTQTNQWVTIRALSLDVARIGAKRYHYMPEFDSKWKYGMALNWDLDFGSHFYWDNQLGFHGTDAQVRNIWWEFTSGIKLDNHLRVFFHHKSEHAAEEKYNSRFPILNEFGFKLVIKQ